MDMCPICFYLFFMLFYSRMKKRVYVVHGWSGKPDGGWRAWFKKELEARGHEVHLLAMPEPDTPRIETWVQFLMLILELKILGVVNEILNRYVSMAV